MSSRRFMIGSGSIRNGYVSLDGGLFNHIVRVLRLNPGDEVTLVDEKAYEHMGIIDQIAKERVSVKIALSAKAPGASGHPAPITICQAIPKGDRIDLILQKCTELGAHDFRIFGGQRSVVRLNEDQREGKLERWNRITSEAARQCGGSVIPAVSWFPSALETAGSSNHDLRLLLWEDEREKRLKNALTEAGRPGSIAVAVGPEGGFDPMEAQHFIRQGFQPVSLGKRILRTETAAIAITAILQYTLEEI